MLEPEPLALPEVLEAPEELPLLDMALELLELDGLLLEDVVPPLPLAPDEPTPELPTPELPVPDDAPLPLDAPDEPDGVPSVLLKDDELGGPLEDAPLPELPCELDAVSVELGVPPVSVLLGVWLSLWLLLSEPELLPGGCWVVAHTGI